jgi:predicted nuclease with RNAse H fold
VSAPPPAAHGGAAAPIVVGIDIAARRPCVAVALQIARSARVVGWMEADHRHPGESARLLEWVEALSPAVVAIDAPQAPNRHLLKGSRLRVCDWELRRRGLPLYQVPARGQPAPEWIAVGFEYFRMLKHRGFEMAAATGLPLSFGGAPALLEAYPYATFVCLLREQHRDAEPTATPPKKGTRAGARMRLDLLRSARVEWDDYYDHDSLDALAAGVTAWRYLQGTASAFGDPSEGLLWLPATADFIRDRLVPRRS